MDLTHFVLITTNVLLTLKEKDIKYYYMLTKFLEYCEKTYEVHIGENASDNWNIIKNASQNDIWFHLGNSMSSPHVVFKNDDNFKIKKIPKQIVIQCASLCKLHSKYHNFKRVNVIYTEIKNIKEGEDIGSVYTKKTLKIII